MAITLTSTGLLFSDNFNRANGTPGVDWTTIDGVIAIEGNRLKVTGGNVRARITAIADQPSIVTQCLLYGPTPNVAAGGPSARHGAAGQFYWSQIQQATINYLIRGSGQTSLVLVGSIPVAYASQDPYDVKLLVRDNQQKSWVHDRVSGTNHTISAIESTLNGGVGTSGLCCNAAGAPVYFDDWFVYKSNVVTVTGLPVGWKARIGTRVATAVAGTASVDLDRDLCPRSLLEILDGSDVVQEDLIVSVWGGDIYNFVAGAVPDAPAILTPVNAQIIDRQLFVTLTDVSASVSDPVEYMVEHEVSTGAGWLPLIDWTSVRPVNHEIYTGTFVNGADHRLRAFARAVGVESAATAIVTFEILHNVAPLQPTVEWLGYSDFNIIGLASAFVSSAPGAVGVSTNWQITTDADEDFLTPLQTSNSYNYEPRIGNMGRIAETAALVLARNTIYRIRGQWVDDAGLISPWSEGVRVMTSNIGIGAHIGVGDIGWAGAFVVGGLGVRDSSGNNKHGRFTYTSGGDGASFLNQGVAVHQPLIPVSDFPSVAISSFAGKGVRLDADSLSPFTAGGGRALTWSVTNTQAEKESIIRDDGWPYIPDWGLLITLLPEWPGAADQDICIIGESRQGTPVSTSRWLSLRILPTAELVVILEHLTHGAYGGTLTISTGITPQRGVPLTLRLLHKFVIVEVVNPDPPPDTFLIPMSIIRLNGNQIYATDLNDMFDGPLTFTPEIADLGHFRLGTFGSANIVGQARHFHGILSSAAFWWDEQLNVNLLGDLPVVENIALDDATIIASDRLLLYWKLEDPIAPTKPTLVQL